MTGKEIYDGCFATLDRIIADTLTAAGQQGCTVTCRKGVNDCNGCCYVQNFVGHHEVQRCLHGMSDEDKEYVKQRTSEWVDKVTPSKFMSIENENDFSAKEFMALGAACPFLRDGKCMVYATRPFNCRVHFAIKDADFCKTAEHQHNQYFLRYPDDWPGYMFLLKTSMLAGGEVVFDLIGLHLARMLLDEHHQSACFKVVHFKN